MNSLKLKILVVEGNMKNRAMSRLQLGHKYEIIGGQKFEYPCYKKGHCHSIDCCTEDMWNAASEEAYRNDQDKHLRKPWQNKNSLIN